MGPAGAATLIGDSIDVTLTGGIGLQDLGIVVGPGVEIQGGNAATNFGAFLFAGESIDIGASSIAMAFGDALGENGMLTFSDLDFGAGIGAVTLTSDNGAVTQADVSSTPTSITLDATDWFFAGGPANLTLTWTEAGATVVPLPAGGLLLLGGLAALPLLRRARRARG